MIEVFDYYAHGLDRNKDVAELHRKAKNEYLKWQKRSQQAKPGTDAANAALEERKRWEKADLLFSTAEGRKKYDQELAAWQNSQEAKNARTRSEQDAQAFASAAETVLDLVARAWEELNKGNLLAARKVAAKAIQTDPTNWEAYLVSGIASYRQDDAEEAMSCLRQAARLNPDCAAVYGGLGELYERLDNWQEAFSNYRKASALEPENTDFQVAMGLVCVKAEAPDEGIRYLRQALEREPDHPGANWALGLALAESARMGWSEVGEGHPRVPAGWYAMSRDQALQAIQKLHEATSLRVEDPDLAKHLAELKSDVDSNVKRHFNGNWVLLGLILALAAFGVGGTGPAILIGLFGIVYYIVNLVPQYATNARVLAGDHALKRGFFDWLDNLTNPWIKLAVLSFLFALLPVFVVYWGVRNWTGQNAPLGNALKQITQPPVAALNEGASSAPSSDPTQPAEQAVPHAPTRVLTETPPRTPSSGLPASTTVQKSLAATASNFQQFISRPNKTKIIVGTVVAFLAIIGVGGGLYLYQGKGADSSGESSLQQDFLSQNKHMSAKWLQESAIVSDYAVQNWGDENVGGMSLLKKSPGKGWSQLHSTGGALSIDDLVNRGVPRTTAEKLLALLEKDSAKTSAKQASIPPVVKQPQLPAGGQPSPQLANAAESITPPLVRVGDTYTYETIDLVEPKLNNVTSREIIDATPGGFTMKFVNAKSGYTRQLNYDSSLNLVSSRSGDGDGFNYSPSLQYFKFPLKSGDTWVASSTETNIKTGKVRTHTLRGKVGEMEQVTVPAGTFNALRITIESELNDQGQISSGQDVSWYVPEVRRTVMSDLESKDATGKLGRRRINLIAYRLQ